MKQSILPEKKKNHYFIIILSTFCENKIYQKMPEIFVKDINCTEKPHIDWELGLSSDFSACHFYLNTNINEDLNVPFIAAFYFIFL